MESRNRRASTASVNSLSPLTNLIAIAVTMLVGLPIFSHAQSLRVLPAKVHDNVQISKQVEFYCTRNYPRADCEKDVLTLRRELATYQLNQLGPWVIVLVQRDIWKGLVRSLGGYGVSPAFTILERQTTIFDQALFSAFATRRVELLQMFDKSGDALLRLAVSHELGHVLCGEPGERRADDYGHDLRDGKSLTCSPSKSNVRLDVAASKLP